MNTNPIPFPSAPALVRKTSARTRKRAAKVGWNVRELPSGKLLATVTDPHTRVRSSQSFTERIEAVKWAKTAHARFELQQATAQKSPFETVAADYLVDLGRRSRSSLHYKTVEQTIDILKAGGQPDDPNRGQGLRDLAAPDAVKIVSKILAGLKTRLGEKASPKTRNNFLVRVNAIANWAVMRDYLMKNKFEQIKYEKIVKRDKPVFSLEDCGRLVDPKHKDHPFYKPLACMLYTGFRGGEMRHMEWEWFLWEANRIALTLGDRATEAQDDDEDGEEDDQHESFISKTGRERVTCLPAELKALMKPKEELHGPVFPELRKMDRGRFQRLFNEYLTHCGVAIIKRRTPHSCRHTWTCIRLASGVNEMLVKQQAGHTEKEMTEHYGKQQDRFRDQIEKAGWERGDMRLHDFIPR